MKLEEILLGEEERMDLAKRTGEEILRDLEREKPVFLVGCIGWKQVCNPGGEAQLQEIKRDLGLRGIDCTGSLVMDALCNKGLDELSLITQLRQAKRSEALLVMACEAGGQAMAAASGKKVVPVLRTVAAGGFRGVLGEKKTCQLCGECFLDLSGGLCPLYFCPKGLLNGPCQGASRGRCEVDIQKPCGWELIYQRLKSEGRLGALKHFAQARDHSQILPLIRLQSTLGSGRIRE
jgi:hypothetical protein